MNPAHPEADTRPDDSTRDAGDRPVLELEDLVMHFGPVRAVDGVSLRIRKGQVTALVGESGSGKSTVGRCIVRLTEPSSGAVRLSGVDVTHLSRSQLRAHRRHVSIVFQDPAGSLDPRMLVGDVVGEPLRLQARRLSRGERAERVAEGLRRGRSAPGGRQPLSPRAVRRAAPAGQPGPRPDVRAEPARGRRAPTSALDVSVQAAVLNLLGRLQADSASPACS